MTSGYRDDTSESGPWICEACGGRRERRYARYCFDCLAVRVRNGCQQKPWRAEVGTWRPGTRAQK
jgi:hypothetical protein